MAILQFILLLALLATVLAALFYAAIWVGVYLMILSTYVPAILGIIGTVFLWRADHDNLGVAVGIASHRPFRLII